MLAEEIEEDYINVYGNSSLYTVEGFVVDVWQSLDTVTAVCNPALHHGCGNTPLPFSYPLAGEEIRA